MVVVVSDNHHDTDNDNDELIMITVEMILEVGTNTDENNYEQGASSGGE